MAWFKKFFKDLTTPTVVPRENGGIRQQPLSTKNTLIVNAAVAQLTSGPDSTLLDKATYVAMPHIIRMVADMGAQNSLGESEN